MNLSRERESAREWSSDRCKRGVSCQTVRLRCRHILLAPKTVYFDFAFLFNLIFSLSLNSIAMRFEWEIEKFQIEKLIGIQFEKKSSFFFISFSIASLNEQTSERAINRSSTFALGFRFVLINYSCFSIISIEIGLCVCVPAQKI